MSKARLDLEKDKFDSEGRVKVSIEQNNAASEDQDVKVINTSADAIPVSIVNPDANIDLQVEIQPNITIDDSTPIDVNVTNTVATNATIQNASLDVNLTNLDGSSRLPVSVDNQPTVTVDDSTPVDVAVTNTVATNAIIQNSELDVNVTNAFQYIYAMVYDGAQWRFQLSDVNGKTINLSHTYYTTSEISAMGISTDVNTWLAAYNDSMLTYKYVGSYNDEFEVEVYLTHPNLGDGNKCLKLVYDYDTQNSLKVVKSIYASVVNWTFDDNVTGVITLTLGAINNPDPNSTIAIGSDICTISVSNTGQGSVTINLSGTNASLYTLRNVTDGITGSSLDYDAAKSFVLETSSDFSGSSYTHSLSITATNNLYGISDSENVATSGTFTGVTWSNGYYMALTNTGSVTEGISVTFQQNWSLSFWVKMSAIDTSYYNAFYWGATYGSSTDNIGGYLRRQGLHIQYRGNTSTPNNNYFSIGGVYFNYTDPGLDDGNWHNIVITWNGHDGTNPTVTGNVTSSNAITYGKIYIDGQGVTTISSGGTANLAATTTLDTMRVGDFVTNSTEPAFDLDEVAFFNYQLTAGAGSDIEKIYNSGIPADLENTSGLTAPIRYLRFENVSDQAEEEIDNATSTATVTNGTTTAY